MKYLSRIVAIAALVTAPVAAQAQISGSFDASANVATVFAFGASTAMTFGSIIPGQATAVTATGSIALQRNVPVTYTIGANPGLLTLVGGTATLQPSLSCGMGTIATAISANWTSCAAGTVTKYAAPTSTTTEYVVFTGSLLTTTSTPPGSYTGTISITAAPVN